MVAWVGPVGAVLMLTLNIQDGKITRENENDTGWNGRERQQDVDSTETGDA